jgi:RNA polymerase primary sigma factor
MLASPRMLDEGIDVPEADLGVIVSASHTKRQSIQRLGRILRKKADGRRARLVVLYAIGTTEDPNASREPNAFLALAGPAADEVRHFVCSDDADDLVDFLSACAQRETENLPA